METLAIALIVTTVLFMICAILLIVSLANRDVFDTRWHVSNPTSSRVTVEDVAPHKFSIIVPYYKSWEPLQVFLHQMVSSPESHRPHVVLVDDGSAELNAHLEEIRSMLGDAVSILELTQDIGYNAGGARNTGAKYVLENDVLKGNNIFLFADVDYSLSPSQVLLWNQLAEHVEERQNLVFRLEGTRNVFMIHSSLFKSSGWYNEDLQRGGDELFTRLRHAGARIEKVPTRYMERDLRVPQGSQSAKVDQKQSIVDQDGINRVARVPWRVL